MRERLMVAGALTFILLMIDFLYPKPVWNMLFVFMLIVFVGAIIRFLYKRSNFTMQFSWLERTWAITITFIFISFTRLFFRSGSDLDPATANETAWKTASDMVTQIGSAWNGNVFEIIAAYKGVFFLFLVGMIIHWLPDRFKRRYRIVFAKLPIQAIGVIAVFAIFIAYQFISSEMKPFIYFQF